MSCGQEDVQGKERKATIEKEYKKRASDARCVRSP